MHCVIVFCRCSKVLNAANNDSLFLAWLRLYTKLARKAAWQLVNRKADFFLQNELIRITNRIDSNRELECSSKLSPTSATVHYSSPDNTIGLVAKCELRGHVKLGQLSEAVGRKLSHRPGNPAVPCCYVNMTTCAAINSKNKHFRVWQDVSCVTKIPLLWPDVR